MSKISRSPPECVHPVHHPTPPPLEPIGIGASIPQIFPIHLQKNLAGKNSSLLALLEQRRPLTYAPMYTSSFQENIDGHTIEKLAATKTALQLAKEGAGMRRVRAGGGLI